MIFSDRYIKNLKGESKKYVRNEGRGFTLVVMPSGTKTFYIRYTFKGKQQEHALGKYLSKSENDKTPTPGFVSLAEARTAFNECVEMLKRGENPKARKIVVEPPDESPYEPQVEPPVVDTTFGKMMEKFLEWSEKNHCDQWYRDTKYTLKKHVPKEWENRPIADIRKIDCIELMEKIEKCGKGAARNAQKAIRGVFTYAEERWYIDNSPIVKLTRAVPSLKPVSRKRYLSEAEIKTVWDILSDGLENSPTKRAILLILVTGQRSSECAGLTSFEIDGEWWTLPPERNKMERYHTIYLTETAKQLIGDAEGIKFPGIDGTKPLKRVSLSHYISDRKYFGLPRWTPHDLRRTARTHMGRIGILDEHAEAVVNHGKEGMTAIYNLYGYDKEKKEALLKWETELLKIIADKETDAASPTPTETD
ncbi:MAG: integrase arm-type DNA-binding domain-containing protein [Pelobacteraceae bacterium]